MFCLSKKCKYCWFCLIVCVLPICIFWGCGGFDIGLYTQVQTGSSLSVTLRPDQLTVPADIQANIQIDFVAGKAGSGEIKWVGAVIEYCIPKQGVTLSGDEIPDSSCLRIDGSLPRLPVASLRLPKKLEQDCYGLTNGASPCFFPGGTTPVKLEVFSDAGHFSPTTKEWKGTEKFIHIEERTEGRVQTEYTLGPCNYPKYVDLLVYVRFKGEPDTFYATRSNGTRSTFFSQSNPKSKFKLNCK